MRRVIAIIDADHKQHPQQQSGLLTILPPEIRCRVFEFVLASGHDNDVVLRRFHEQKRLGKHSPLSLLAVCRATHNEAAGLFYYHHTLKLDVGDLKQFVTSMSLPRRASIRRLQVEIGWMENATTACRYLRYMPHIADVLLTFVKPLCPFNNEDTMRRELSMLKRCRLKLVDSASIRLEFKQGVRRTQTDEACLMMYQQAIIALQLPKAKKSEVFTKL